LLEYPETKREIDWKVKREVFGHGENERLLRLLASR